MFSDLMFNDSMRNKMWNVTRASEGTSKQEILAFF